MLSSAIQVVNYHDRAKTLPELIQAQMEDEGILDANDFATALKECSCHAHNRIFADMASQNTLKGLSHCTSEEWSTILSVINCHHSKEIVLCLLRNIPDAHLGNEHIEHVWYHHRSAVAIEMQQFLRQKRKMAKEIDEKLQKMLEDTKLSVVPQVKKENDLAAAEMQMEVKIPLINPGNVKECEITEDEKEQCCSCLTNKRQVLNLACGHRSLCLECAATFTKKACPLCQESVTSWLVSV